MAKIIDLTDLLDPEDAKIVKAKLLRDGNKFLGPKQTLHRPKAAPAPYKGMKKDRVARQVLFYDIYNCKCGSTQSVPRLRGQLFNHIIDNPHQSHYVAAQTRLVGIPKEVEWVHHSLTFCPECLNSPVYDSQFERMNAFRARELNPCKRDKMTDEPLYVEDKALPKQLFLASEEEPQLDFTKWLHKPSQFPLAVASPIFGQLKGIRYVKARRTWLARTFPRYPRAAHVIKCDAEFPYPHSQIEGGAAAAHPA